MVENTEDKNFDTVRVKRDLKTRLARLQVMLWDQLGRQGKKPPISGIIEQALDALEKETGGSIKAGGKPQKGVEALKVTPKGLEPLKNSTSDYVAIHGNSDYPSLTAAFQGVLEYLTSINTLAIGASEIIAELQRRNTAQYGDRDRDVPASDDTDAFIAEGTREIEEAERVLGETGEHDKQVGKTPGGSPRKKGGGSTTNRKAV